MLTVLESGRLALGEQLLAFEAGMARRCGTRYAVAVSSGTAALHLIVRGLGLGAGDEVITTPFSFVASANALLFEGVRPRFVDIDPATYNLDVTQAAEAVGPATKGLLAVDVFGVPAPWPALTALARAHDLLLIDDACEALGASVEGRPVGAWGNAAAFGFYPNKQITTGEGGCLTTDDAALAERCRSMRNQGRGDDAVMTHVRLGDNYRMDMPPDDRIHDPLLRLGTLDSSNIAAIIHAKQDHATLEVGHGNYFLSQLFRANVIPFEFHTGILAIGDYLENGLLVQHPIIALLLFRI